MDVRLDDRSGWLAPAAVLAKSVEQWVEEAIERLDLAMPFVRERGSAAQGGACLGYWAKLLVDRYGFKRVLSFEPDAVNFRCASENLKGVDGVTLVNSALGKKLGTANWSRASEHKPGWHKIAPVGCRPKHIAGTVSVTTIDSFNLDSCDFLALDIEGSELEALKGAEQTIARCRPVILFEDLGRSKHEGFRKRSTVAYGNSPGAVQRWLAERGYAKVGEVKNDECWAPE